MVTDEEPDPETLAPDVPAVTVSVPSVTDRVTVMEPLPASTSAMLRPLALRLSDTCSVFEYEAGVMVATGASFTAVMLMVDVAVDTRLPPVPVLPLSSLFRARVDVADGVSVLST